MARIIFAICGLLFFVAAQARADWGTTRPSMKVAVAPFTVHGDTGGQWLGRAMQEGLATGLHDVSGMIVAGVAPDDTAGAINMTRDNGAQAVIFGSIQVVGGQIRVSGQIISIDTAESLGVLRCDGSQRDLFNIEDILSARVDRILAPPPVNRAAAGGPAVLQVVGPTVAPGPSRYFDGNLMAQLTPPARNRDEYDKYYYYSADTSCYSSCYSSYCGGPWGAWCGGFGAIGGGGCPVVSVPVHGW